MLHTPDQSNNAKLRYFPKLLSTVSLAISISTPLASAQSNSNVSDLAENIDIELFYPDQLNTGDAFTIYARTTNNSDRHIYIPMVQGYWSLNSSAGEYTAIPCRSDCNLSGSTLIAPGGKALVKVSDVYFRGEQFVSGELSTTYPDFYASAADGETVVIAGEGSHNITVTHREGANTENTLVTRVPERVALTLTDLQESGDQKLVHDPNTGNDWLRFDNSLNMTEAELYQALAADGMLAGFSIASITEVETLILNHVHAQNLAAQPMDLYYNPRTELRPIIGELVELIQSTSPAFVTVPDTLGIVRDRAPVSPDGDEQFQTFTLKGDPTTPGAWRSSPYGAKRMPVSKSEWGNTPVYEGGIWLVRGAAPEPSRPSGRASFYDRELLIPNVLIDGANYQVHLELLSSNPERFRVTTMQVVDAAENAAEFDATHGVIELNAAGLLIDSETTALYNLTLALIPGTQPPVLEVVSMSPAAASGEPGSFQSFGP